MMSHLAQHHAVEHNTSYGGYGKTPPRKAIQMLANQANFDDWKKAKIKIGQIIDELHHFTIIAKTLGVSQQTTKMIVNYQNQLYRANKGILTS